MPPPERDPITARIRAVQAARVGRDHPMLDTWTAEARDLYERCHSREVQRFAAEFPPLTSDQRHALAVLLAPAPHHTDPAHAGRAATAC